MIPRIGPDPEDVGGLAELKWIVEYADLHGHPSLLRTEFSMG
jgi:hypothetical protein